MCRDLYHQLNEYMNTNPLHSGKNRKRKKEFVDQRTQLMFLLFASSSRARNAFSLILKDPVTVLSNIFIRRIAIIRFPFSDSIATDSGSAWVSIL